MVTKQEKALLALTRLYRYYGKRKRLVAQQHELWKVVIATILSARTRDETTAVVWPSLTDLARAKPREVMKVIRPIGFYRQKARYVLEVARLIAEQGVPQTRDQLMKLPGVGRKTANIILSAMGKPAIAVDTHVHKIANRLGLADTRKPVETETQLMKLLPKRYWNKINYIFVIHGKTLCKRKPRCDVCPLHDICDFAS